MKTFTENGTTYTTTTIKVKNTEYKITVVKGNFNYINVKKVTANPFTSIGKDFANFDEASRNYKNADMKIELLKLETLIF